MHAASLGKPRKEACCCTCTYAEARCMVSETSCMNPATKSIPPMDRIPVEPATDGTYTTVVAVAVNMSPKDSAPVTPKPVSTEPKDNVPGMPTDIRRRPCLSTPALKDIDDVLADTNRVSAATGSSKREQTWHVCNGCMAQPQIAPGTEHLSKPSWGSSRQLHQVHVGLGQPSCYSPLQHDVMHSRVLQHQPPGAVALFPRHLNLAGPSSGPHHWALWRSGSQR